jgi:hypothetical protein
MQGQVQKDILLSVVRITCLVHLWCFRYKDYASYNVHYMGTDTASSTCPSATMHGWWLLQLLIIINYLVLFIEYACQTLVVYPMLYRCHPILLLYSVILLLHCIVISMDNQILQADISNFIMSSFVIERK